MFKQRRLDSLSRSLGLQTALPPYPVDAKQICRRVEKTLSAQPKERRSYMFLKIRLAAAATAAVMALGGTAVGVGPTLGEALLDALGGFAFYAQKQEGAVTDQGIRVRVVSALADQTTLRVYAEVTDLTGDRLAGAKIDGIVKLELEGETSWGIASQVVSYDSEARTALMCFTKYAGMTIPAETEAVLRIGRIQPGYHNFSADSIPVELIPAGYVEEQKLESGETVLIPGQTDYALTGEKAEGVILSSIGFASDGRLHFLFQFPGKASETSHGICTVYSRSWTEESGTADTKFNRNFENVTFTVDGVTYHDFAVSGTPEELYDIKELAYPGGVYISGEKVEGTWEVPVVVKRIEDVTSPLSGVIDHSTLRELVLSPYGVIVRTTSPDYTQIGGYPLSVFLADGTILRPESTTTGGGFNTDEHTARWEFAEPVEIGEITGVAIGCWMIPVENGVAGEGYWLAELP